MDTISFKRHRFAPEIIRRAVWLYARFTLSYRDVEDLLAERGLDISYESVRRWFLKLGAPIARNLRHTRPIPNGYWHIDERVIVIRGQRYSTTLSKWTLRRMNPRTTHSRQQDGRWRRNPLPYSSRPRWLRERMSSVAEILAFLGIRRSLFLPRRNSLFRNLRPISRSVPVSGRSGSSSRIEQPGPARPPGGVEPGRPSGLGAGHRESGFLAGRSGGADLGGD